MKILKIIMQNINSLKGRQEIDFTSPYFQDGIFAITGETGSGKTTILDAISVSLYGKTPRLSQVNDLMTRGSNEISCEVWFEIRGGTYKSRYFQTKTKTGNFNTGQMEFSIHNEILETGISKVPKKIEEITGLDFERFTKSILLAQGSFDSFLKAKDGEKSAILEKFSDTTIYRKISQIAFEKSNNSREIYENLKAEREKISIYSKEDLDRFEKEKNDVEAKLELKKEEKTLLYAEIEVLKNYHKKEVDAKNLSLELIEIGKKIYEKGDFQNRFLDFQKSYSNNIETISKVERLDEKIYEIKRVQKKLALEIDEKEDEISKLTREIEKLEGMISIYEIEKERIEEYIFENRKDSSIFEKYALFENQLHHLSNERRELQELKNSIPKDLDEQKIELISNLNSLEKERENLINNLKQLNLDLLLKERELFQQKILEAQKRVDLEENFQFLNSEKERFSNDLKFINSNHQTLLKELAEISEIIEQLKAKREQERSIINYEKERNRLQEGEACPLCGSTTHPLFSEKIYIDETERILKKHEENFKKLKREADTKRVEIAELETSLKRAENDISKNREAFSEIPDIHENLENLNTSLENVNSKISEMVKKENDLKGVVSKISKIEKDISQINSNIAKREDFQNRLTVFKRNKETLKNQFFEFNIDEVSQNSMELLKTRMEVFKSKENELEEMSEKIQTIKTDIVNFRNKISFSEDVKRKKELEKLEYLNSFEKFLKERKELFADNDLKIFRSQIEAEKEKMDNEKSLFDKLKNSFGNIEDQLQKVKEELKNFKISDKPLLELENKHSLLEDKISFLYQELGGLNRDLDLHFQNIENLKNSEKEFLKSEKEYKKWSRLNELIGSKNGDKLQKFAQEITLNMLVSIANKQLLKLTDRYLLEISEDKNSTSKSYLNIFVKDRYFGESSRKIETLSGGETFLISLALALALSDFSSQEIEINTLFLDEGFGTLDENSLEIVLSALNSIQNSGKTIGVISHVQALKERILSQINVEKIGNGNSKITFPNK
jgi:exonuclease SbcC